MWASVSIGKQCFLQIDICKTFIGKTLRKNSLVRVRSFTEQKKQSNRI